MNNSSRSDATRTKILLTAMNLIRQRGYGATRVDDICEAAGITKGAFFHHFKSKEAMATAAGEFWSSFTGAFFANAPYQSVEDPMDRLFAYLDFREAIISGELEEFTCLAGTMVQETYHTHPAIRVACRDSIWSHAETLVPLIQAAIDQGKPAAALDARELALFTQAALQGGFVLAKAQGDAAPAIAAVQNLRRYLALLFQRNNTSTTIGEANDK